MDDIISTEFRSFYVHPQCGTGDWQRKYSNLHYEMMKRPKKDQLIAIYDGHRNGAGDRLTMSVTVFLYALLTGRAFKIKWAGTRLEDALDYVGVNWSYETTDDSTAYGYVEVRDYMTHIVNYERLSINKIFRRKNLSSIGTSAPPFNGKRYSKYIVKELDFPFGNDTARTVVWRLNQGQIWTLFDNPYHKKELYSMGLRPENAFGCVIHFLYQLQPETIQIVEQQWEQILGIESDPVDYIRARPGYGIHRPYTGMPKKISIGLQIRFGDQVIEDPSICVGNTSWADNFFYCAKVFAREAGFPLEILLLTDCLYLRENVKELYPNFTVLTTTLSYNSTCKHRIMHVEDAPANQEAVALRWIISEIWMMSVADVQIISQRSSIGKVSSLISLSWHQMLSFDNYDKEQDVDVKYECGLTNFLDWKSYAHSWIRI